MIKPTLALAGLVLLANTANAAVSYTIGLKVDDISDYEAFGQGDLRCADSGGGGIYQIDADYGCEAAGFKIVDILPSPEETFQLGSDSVIMTVDEIKDGGEVVAASVEIRLVDPQTYVPVSATLKAGTDIYGGFDFTYNELTGAFESSFEFCVAGVPGSSCAGISNVEITFASPVPVPAAAWLFGTALIGLVGVKRKK